MANIALESVISCPVCGFRRAEQMPINRRVYYVEAAAEFQDPASRQDPSGRPESDSLKEVLMKPEVIRELRVKAHGQQPILPEQAPRRRDLPFRSTARG